MEPQIRYVTTADGVSIPYWRGGSGTPLVCMPALPFSHLLEQWRFPEWRAWDERLMRGRQVVRYEHRGCGMADRTMDFSLESLVADVEALVDELELERFDLAGIVHSGVVAIAYAAKHPERVRSLTLWCSYASNREYGQSPQVTGSRALIPVDWDLYSETTGHRLLGWEHGDGAHRFASLMRASISPDGMQAFYEQMAPVDVRPLLRSVEAPTLVLQRKSISWFSVEIGQRLAAGIPGARLAVVEGTSIAWFIEGAGEIRDQIEAFLREADGRDGALTAMARTGDPASSEVPLTPREMEILGLLCTGDSNKEISARLGLSVRTVERHVTNVFAKIDARGRTEAVAYALRHGIGPR